MTPLQLLSLWRERWGKADSKNLVCPYESSNISDWNQRWQQSLAGRLPGVGLLALAGFVGLTLLLMTVRFTLTEQTIFSVMLFAASFWIRRFQGKAVSLMLAGMAIISTARYLDWRLLDSLAPAYSVDYFVRLGLLLLEFYGVFIFVCNALQRLWPAWLSRVDSAEGLAVQPRLGVFILASGFSRVDVERSISAITGLKWQQDRLNIYVLDATDRADLRRICTELRASYLTYSEVLLGNAGLINRALLDSKEELIAVLQAGHVPAHEFLRLSAGWLQAEAALGLVSTAQHFLLPALTESLRLEFCESGTQSEFLVAKRSVLVSCGGVPIDPVDQHLANRLRESGWGHICVVKHNQQIRGLLNPYPGAAVRWRMALEAANPVLAFYRPLLPLALLTLPLLYLLANIAPVQSPVPVILVYLVPHWGQSWLLANRLESKKRLPLLIELQELLLALYIFVLTSIFVVLTQFRERKQARNAELKQTVSKSPALESVAWRGLAGLHACAWLWGGWTMLHANGEQLQSLGFYLGWSALVVMVMAARYAVIRETQEIARHKRALRVMPAMIRLQNNRTLSCKTSNFPAVNLHLSLPPGAQLEPNQSIQLSIFQSYNEFVFDAQVLSVGLSGVDLCIEPASKSQYEAFTQAALARGSNWPAWLPAERVDQIFPNGLMKAIEGLGRGLGVLWFSITKRSIKLAVAQMNTKWKKKT